MAEVQQFEKLIWQVDAVIGAVPLILLVPLWIDALYRRIAPRLRLVG